VTRGARAGRSWRVVSTAHSDLVIREDISNVSKSRGAWVQDDLETRKRLRIGWMMEKSQIADQGCDVRSELEGVSLTQTSNRTEPDCCDNSQNNRSKLCQ
jgi:hypothetical protein